MIGPNYWTTGITVCAQRSQHDAEKWRWSAHLDYFDNGWLGDDDSSIFKISTQGVLRTRYFVESVVDNPENEALRAVLDVLIADAKRLGIELKDPSVYYHGDGEDPDHVAPTNWRDLVREQNERLGWRHLYSRPVQEGQST